VTDRSRTGLARVRDIRGIGASGDVGISWPFPVYRLGKKNRADEPARSACALLVDQNFTVTRAK
jgi:hypothetical protein